MTGGEQITRTAFKTSRLIDFVSEKELTAQIGYPSQEWALIVVKELVDNALDACEEQGIAPEVTVTVSDDCIMVEDNGDGIPVETVDALLDFSVRVSSREAYVAPDRGAQGNALKTIVAIPFILDGRDGRVDMCGDGTLSQIALTVDRIQQRPVADVSRSGKTGSYVRVYWPEIPGSEDDTSGHVLTNPRTVIRRLPAIRQILNDFTFLNPHLTLTLDLFGEATTVKATNREWRKWMPSRPTSPHWYELEQFERLVGANITHDTQRDQSTTVREFVSTFKGLSGTAKQKQVLAVMDMARAPLNDLVLDRDFNHALTAKLLAVMKDHSNPPKPRALGHIGRSHIEERCNQLGLREGSFEYRKIESLGDDALPQVTEIGWGALADEDESRRLVTGVNWSAGWRQPFRMLGAYGDNLDALLSERRFERTRPIVVVLHVAHPRVQYTDRGKSTVVTE